MTGSLKLTAASAYQDYVQDNRNTLVSKMYHGFDTANLITAHRGLKAKKPLTEMLLGSLIKAWKAGWDPTADAIDFAVREIDPKHNKINLGLYPEEFEETYLGHITNTGQSIYEFPFQEYFLDRVSEKKASEIEEAIWAGVRAGTVTAGTTPLNQVVDGFKEICDDAVTATDITAVVTGAITSSNAIASAEAMWSALGKGIQNKQLGLFVSYAHALKLRQNFSDNFGKYSGQFGESFRLPNLPNVTVYPVGGISGDWAIMTPPENLHYSYGWKGADPLTFEYFRGEISTFSSLWIGVQIAILHDDVVAVNDQ